MDLLSLLLVKGLSKDLSTGKVIGHGREDRELYIFEGQRNHENQRVRRSVAVVTTSIEEIELWHARYGYVPLPHLKLLFPQRFKTVASISFKCEVCELSKHTRVSYPPSGSRSTNSFKIVHSDVGTIPNHFNI